VAAVDDVSFALPVSIGDVVTFSAQVVYTGADEEGSATDRSLASAFQVRVETQIIELHTGQKRLSNEFHFTFVARDASVKDTLRHLPMPPVRPTTYREGMLWLDGRRRMLEAVTIGKSEGSSLFSG